MKHIYFSILIFLMVIFSISYAAEKPSKQPAAIQQGKIIYQSYCAACHGENGKGKLQGMPDLTDKNGSLAKPKNTLLEHIEKDYKGPDSIIAMPAKGGNSTLTRKQLEQALSYMLAEFI